MADERLIDFIQKSLSAGRSEEEIREDLLRVGWQENQIEEAFAQVKGQTVSDIGDSSFQKPVESQPKPVEEKKPIIEDINLEPVESMGVEKEEAPVEEIEASQDTLGQTTAPEKTTIQQPIAKKLTPTTVSSQSAPITESTKDIILEQRRPSFLKKLIFIFLILVIVG